MISRIIRRTIEVFRQEIAWYGLRKAVGTKNLLPLRPGASTDYRMMRSAR